ncbi:MAG: FtsW/RodA/SpoVE family cell cycle protein [Fimbriimonas sp.]
MHAGSLPLEQKRGLRIDWLLIAATLIMLVIGLMSLYSEGDTRDHGAVFKKQIVFTFIGIVPFGIFATVPPKFWQRISWWLYGVNVLALLAVRFVGSEKKGAERWIEFGPMQFQPSEMAKLLTIITLSAFFAYRQDAIRSFSTFALSLLHISIPLGLILMQPHLGAALVILVSWFAISLVAGVPIKFLGGTVAAFACFIGLMVAVPSLPGLVLQPYQLDRLYGMIQQDDTGKSWQTDRAQIAFANGSVMGTGYLNGTQKAGHFIPEQNNDFIFTVVGEEGGLIGCTLVLLAFGFFFFRVWLVMFLASELYYRMLAAGVFAALFFHMFVNIGMVLKVLPVVGLWLPFLSSGGTALWLCLACVGLLLSIRRREAPVLFS